MSSYPCGAYEMGNALFTKLSRRNLCTHFCIVRIVSGMAKWQAMYTDVTNSGNPAI